MNIQQLRTATHAVALVTGLVFPAAGYAQMYLGGGGGEAQYKDIDEVEAACAAVSAVCTADDKDTAFKFFLGYRFTPNVAVEGGYIDMGEATADAAAPFVASASLSAQGAYLALLPQVPIGNVGSIFGRIGVSAVDAELSASGGGLSASDSSGAAGLVFGAGADIHLTDTVSIRGEWERHSFDEALEIGGVEIDAPDIDVLSASLVLRF